MEQILNTSSPEKNLRITATIFSDNDSDEKFKQVKTDDEKSGQPSLVWFSG